MKWSARAMGLKTLRATPAQRIGPQALDRMFRQLRLRGAALATFAVYACLATNVAAAPQTFNLWCLSWLDPTTGVVEQQIPSRLNDKIKTQFQVTVDWDIAGFRFPLRIRGLPTKGMETMSPKHTHWKPGSNSSHWFDVVEPQIVAGLSNFQVTPPGIGGSTGKYAKSMHVALSEDKEARVQFLGIYLFARDDKGGTWTITTVECQATPWTTSTSSQQPAAASTATAASVAPVSGTASVSAPLSSFNSAPVASQAPSADAELSYRGTLLAALIGAMVAVLLGLPTLRAARRQAKAAEDALEFSRQEAASNKSMQLMLQEGPQAIVARLQRLSDQALRAADSGDTAGFASNAKALADLRNSLHRSLLAAVAPLNSTLEKMSQELDRSEPDLDEVMRLLRISHAAMPEKAEELRIHLRQLLAAISTVLASERGDGRTAAHHSRLP